MKNNFSSETIKNLRRRFYWLGGIHFVVGMLALAVPMVASLTLTVFVGAMLLLLGIMQGWNTYTGFRHGDRSWSLLFSAAAAIVAGLVFLFQPLTGVIALSILLAAYLFMDGITKISEYYRLKGLKNSYWLLLSGIMAIILAILIVSNFWSGLSIIGIIFGVNMIFSGVTLMVMAESCSSEDGYCDL